MSRISSHRLFAVLGAAALTVASLAAVAGPANAGSTEGHGTRTAASSVASGVKDVCGKVPAGYARCFAEIRTDAPAPKHAAANATTAPNGFGPADLHAAYHLPTTGGTDQTVAIVDAGDDATAEADLAVYRSTYGLPACTTANGCFHKVNQRGAATPLPPDRGWGVEIALDLDMVSAACPQCKILLVESDDALGTDLAAAVDEAVALGADEVSNSYGITESSLTPGNAKHYQHPGTAILASSGDYGYGIPSEPAVFSSVIAVGGTSLTKDSSARGWSESAWQGAGSGCSAWVDKPAWQSDPNCPGRMTSDVSAVADPNTGLAVYTVAQGAPGWIIVGGTSASSPFLAGVIALGGHPAKFADASPFYAASAQAGLYDVVSGNNGIFQDCGGDYQCNGAVGYDGPTGMGTPNGLGAF
ncbi:S53 family peptidase [Catenulispora subtropica]|uniref:S53 family peptidase n=1 Tax=Catenulispora subtropica TaxID=450798 RepID=UPI0031D66B07